MDGVPGGARGLFLGGRVGMAGNVDEDSGHEKQDEETGAAVGDVGERKALGGEAAGDDAYVDEGLEGDQDGDAEGEELPPAVDGAGGNAESRQQEENEEQDDG